MARPRFRRDRFSRRHPGLPIVLSQSGSLLSERLSRIRTGETARWGSCARLETKIEQDRPPISPTCRDTTVYVREVSWHRFGHHRPAIQGTGSYVPDLVRIICLPRHHARHPGGFAHNRRVMVSGTTAPQVRPNIRAGRGAAQLASAVRDQLDALLAVSISSQGRDSSCATGCRSPKFKDGILSLGLPAQCGDLVFDGMTPAART